MQFARKAGSFQSPGSQSQAAQQIHVVNRRTNLADQFLQETQLLCNLPDQSWLQKEDTAPPFLSENKGNHHELLKAMLARQPIKHFRSEFGKSLSA